MTTQMKPLFLDTETTGNTENNWLCQVAHKIDGVLVSNLYKPREAIPVEAMAVHHITNKMVADKPAFVGSSDYEVLKKYLSDPSVVFVAHNAPFDIGMLKKEGLNVPRFICTLRLTRYLDEKNKIPRHNLQYLRYFFDMEIDAQAHDAAGDVLVLEQLFARQLAKFTELHSGDQEKALAQMIEISSRPVIMHTFNFGKYKDQKVRDIALKDPGYLEWMLKAKQESDTNEEDWIYTLTFYLDKNASWTKE